MAAVHDATSDLEREVCALGEGDHLCLLYEDSPREQFPAILPYIREGLRNGERCVYVVDDLPEHELRDALKAFDIDVADEESRGALVIWTRADWRQPGPLDSAVKAAQVRGAIADALAAGYTGVRFAVDATWTLDPDIETPELWHWEATVNTIVTPGVPARVLCQYSRRRINAAALHVALTTHPIAIIGEDVCANPYYDAPLLLNSQAAAPSPADPARVDWMLAQLRSSRAYARERELRAGASAALAEAGRAHQQLEELYQLAEIRADELRRASAVKDEFIGLVSHELRTPVTVILGNAEVLLKHLIGATPEQRQALLDVQSEAERLNRVVANLLSLASVDTRQELELDPVFIEPLLDRVVAEHRRRHPTREVTTHRRAPRTPVMGNETAIDQMLANLLSNAEKYSPPGAPIDVVIEFDGDAFSVAVLDRGIGVAEDDFEAVFDAFFRAEHASRTASGIGIGLTVCRRLAEAQDGRAWAKPRPGGGAEFGFALPYCNEAELAG